MPAEATHAALFWQDSDGKEHVTVLDHDRMTIGRQDSDLEIRDPAISRNHAYIDRVEGGYRLTDAKSKQGTFVNGEEISSHVLKFGTRSNSPRRGTFFSSERQTAAVREITQM